MQQAKNFLIITFVINFAFGLGFYMMGFAYSGTMRLILGFGYMFVPMMLAFKLALSPIFNYLMIINQSILVMPMVHGVLHAFAGITIFSLAGSTALAVGITSVAGIIELCLVILAIYIYDRFIAKQNIMSHKISAHIWPDGPQQE